VDKTFARAMVSELLLSGACRRDGREPRTVTRENASAVLRDRRDDLHVRMSPRPTRLDRRGHAVSNQPSSGAMATPQPSRPMPVTSPHRSRRAYRPK
jgi:hypothetical protein